MSGVPIWLDQALQTAAVALLALGAGLFLAYSLFVLFLAVMSLQTAKAQGKITAGAYRLAYSVLLLGWVLDFIVNATLASLLFLELPQELTVSARVLRHVKDAGGWRRTVACWLQANLLAPFDPSGRHG
jgi:hypothetical protein